MSSPLISVRKLDSNHDPVYGNGQADFLTDIDAVAQMIQTNLLLFQGEWWEDLSQGFPLFQQVLGTPNAVRNPSLIALLIQQQILAVDFVTQVLNAKTAYDPIARRFSYSSNVATQFGTISVTFTPGSSAAIPTN